MQFQERDFFKERFTADELGQLLGAESPRTLFNFKSAAFKKSGLDGDALSDQTLLDMLLEEPRYFRRPLVVVARETPLHRTHLLNMLAVTDMGGVILPPIPGFYAQPKTIEDLVDHTVGKILDALGVENEMFSRWEGKEPEE